MLEDGTYRSAAEIAEAEAITRSFVNRLLRLTLLAPDIVEAILDGRQAKGILLEELTRIGKNTEEGLARNCSAPGTEPHSHLADPWAKASVSTWIFGARR